jgi:hypothetical protein
VYSDSSTTHMMIRIDASLFVNKSFSGWFVMIVGIC